MAPVRSRHPSQSKSTAVRLAALYPSRRQVRKWQREHRVQRWVTGGLIGLLVLIVAILGFGYWRENYYRASEYAAVVNGEPITLAQLLERVKPRAAALDAQAAFYQQQGFTQAAAQMALQRSRLPDQVLDSMIEDRLVAAELEKRGIPVTDQEVQARIEKDIAEQEALSQPSPTPTASPAAAASPAADASPAANASPAAEATPTPAPTAGPTATPTAVPTLTADAFQTAYQSFLDRANLTDEAYRELVRADVARDKLREDMAKQIPRTEEQVHARHILVDSQEALQQVQEALANGVPFDQVAREHSTDSGTRDKGGDLGWFGRGQMNAPFEQAAFTQPIGEIGPPVESPNGTHIIQVLERDPNHPLTQEQIDQKAAQAYQAWYSGVRNSDAVTSELSPDERAWIMRQISSRRGGTA